MPIHTEPISQQESDQIFELIYTLHENNPLRDCLLAGMTLEQAKNVVKSNVSVEVAIALYRHQQSIDMAKRLGLTFEEGS